MKPVSGSWAYSTRSLASLWALVKGISVEDIWMSWSWSFPNTFCSHLFPCDGSNSGVYIHGCSFFVFGLLFCGMMLYCSHCVKLIWKGTSRLLRYSVSLSGNEMLQRKQYSLLLHGLMVSKLEKAESYHIAPSWHWFNTSNQWIGVII